MANTKTKRLEQIRDLLGEVYEATKALTPAPMNDVHKAAIYKKFHDEVAELLLG